MGMCVHSSRACFRACSSCVCVRLIVWFCGFSRLCHQSTRDDHRRIGADILDQALRYRTRGLAKARSAGQQVKETLRVGISGPPGVGKSTFIEALGVALIRDHGLRVAVIAIDPTSHKSSGAILGDKTRMTDLSMMAEAFVRPCAAGFKHLGGLSLHSDELVLLCEAAGYDVVLIETVGVGQSETLVTEVADMCVLLLPPAGGDELQGIKRGIVETADLIVVNKADGDLLMAAKRARSEYRAALHVMHSTHAVAADQDGLVGQRAGKHAETREWEPRVTLVSATTGLGIDTVCGLLFEYLQVQVERGQLHARRSGQRGAWMWRKAEADLVSLLGAAPAVASRAGLGPSPRAGRMRAQNRQGWPGQ